MKNKTIEILKTFSNKDVKRFNEFLCSDFLNKSKKLLNFYNHLIKFHPDFDSKLLTEENLSKKTCPENKFNRLTINCLFFDLSNAAKQYLKMLAVEKYTIESDDLLRRELMKRKLFGLLEENIRSSKKKIVDSGDFSANNYVNMFYLLTDTYNLNKITKPKSTDILVRTTIDVITERGRYLIFLFITEMVREYENIITLGKTYDAGTNENFIITLFNSMDFCEMMEKVIENENDSIFAKLIRLYLYLLLTFSNFDNEEYYFRYKKLFIENYGILNNDERRFHLGRLHRYCVIKNQMKGLNNKFSIELFNVHEQILKNENYKSSVMRYMPVELYRNILLHGLRLKKYLWTVNFIKKYSKLLKPERQQNIFHFSLAEYFFSRKKYKKVKQHLNEIIFEEFIYKLHYRNLLLMTHFELEEYESAIYLVDSYKHLLSKDTTFAQEYKKRNKKFVDIVHKLILYKTSANKTSSFYIEKEYDENFPYKDWVNEKIAFAAGRIKKAV